MGGHANLLHEVLWTHSPSQSGLLFTQKQYPFPLEGILY